MFARRSWFKPKVALISIVAMAFLGLGVSASAAPPANDNFGGAVAITPNALPFQYTTDVTQATTENGEPFYCSYSYQTIWFKFTATDAVWLRGNTLASGLYGTSISVFRDSGSGFFGLSFVGCSAFDGYVTFLAQAGATYYIQALAPCCFVSGSVRLDLEEVPAPVPVAAFYFYPSEPSNFDNVQFYDQSFDPGQVGIQSQAWDLGDGTTATGCCPAHLYAADGNYNVHLTVTTYDGRTADTTRVVAVRTHDVAITKFKAPQSASAGQTRQLSVGIKNNRYPETVRVELLKSVTGGYGGFQTVGYLDLFVPVRSSNRTTNFDFSYTFTGADAQIGKVTFKAVANLLSGHDALMADNEAISSPTKVSGSGAAPPDSVPAPALAKDAEVAGSETAPMAQLAILDVAPNPAKSGVDLLVRLSVPGDGAATLQLLDVAGRVMTKRDLGSLGPGIHEERVTWDRRPAPGIYWVRLTQRDKSVSSRVGILR